MRGWEDSPPPLTPAAQKARTPTHEVKSYTKEPALPSLSDARQRRQIFPDLDDDDPQPVAWCRSAPFRLQATSPKGGVLVEKTVLPPTSKPQWFRADAEAAWGDFYTALQDAVKRKHSIAVVLLWNAPFSPFTTFDLDVLQRARSAIQDTYKETQVVGAVCAPQSDRDLAKMRRGVGIKSLLPFRARVELARRVIANTKNDSWIVVDGCLEGCLKTAEGPLAPYLTSYAKGRLHSRECQIKVVEIHTADMIVAGDAMKPFDCLLAGKGPQMGLAVPHISELRGVVLDIPKERLCSDAIRAEACASALSLGAPRKRVISNF